MKSVYCWAKKGKQKRIEQSQRKGKRLNICGLLEKGKKFDHGLTLKSFQGENYLKLMNWQAEQAAERLAQKGQITAIVEDQVSFYILCSQKESREISRMGAKKIIYSSLTQLFIGT